MNDIELYKPNELISVISEMELTRTARHLFNYFLQHAQREIKFNKDFSPVNTFKINISELNSEAEIIQRDYKLIKQSLRKLMQPVAVTNNKHHITEVVPVTFVDVDLKSGDYVFRLEPLVIDLLKNNEYFTKLNLKEFNPFKSKHTIIIFEYIKQYEKNTKIPVITIEKLRQITETTNKYKNFSDFQLKVLEQVKKEINESSKYIFDYELIKTRTKRRPKVTSIQFKLQKKMFIDVNLEQTIRHYEKYEDLFSSLKNTFIDLTIEDLYIADYRYTLDTLVLFAQQTEKYSAKNSKDFHQWLDDRTRMFKGYEYRENNIDNCYKALQYLTKKETENNISCTSENYLPMALLPPDLLKKEPDNEYVIEAKAQYGKFCYRDYIQYMYDLYEKNKEAGTQNLIEPFLCREDY